ncbi:uncharacterized protein LOC132202047 [Neocloeon triangulifer]|uniref:uncharacterized protein LOC132202047 n=1 Tax=Neocloeon triangulifer TaxID=2078957 RepID=UPI00286EE217|nr:uncharacterized protein LOC132202047 [Neocloeon triangulifer]
MNNRLMDVIKEHAPDSWDFLSKAVSSGLNYNILEVNTNSREFLHVIADLRKHDEIFEVKWVRRIQNLSMYGRYALRHQQLMVRNRFNPANAKEEIRYACIHESKIDSLAQRNLDARYLAVENFENRFNKSELFTNVLSAIREMTSNDSNWVLVMARVTTEGGKIVSDSEIYPEYVLKLKMKDVSLLWG